MIAGDIETLSEFHVLANGQRGGFDVHYIYGTVTETENHVHTYVTGLVGLEQLIHDIRETIRKA